jgi:hypothetical protein
MRSARNVLIITFWSFDDALVQTYTLPYLRLILKNLPVGSQLFLFTQQGKSYHKDAMHYEAQKLQLAELNIHVIQSPYRRFGLMAIVGYAISILKLILLCYRKKITIVHSWCTPGGAIGYIVSLFSGTKLILDSFEPHAEAMVENGSWRRTSLAFRILWYLEQKQTKRALCIIGTTPGMKSYAKLKFGVEINNFFVKPACVDLEQFSLQKRKNPLLLKELNLDGKKVCLYAGKFGGLYLKEEVFEFFQSAYLFWKDELRILLLTAHSEEEILSLARKFALPLHIFVIKFVPHRDIADYLGLADFAITPFKPVPARKYGSPIKDGEYWAMGIPVLITENISVDSDIILQNNIGYVWKEPTKVEFDKSVRFIDKLLSHSGQELTLKIRTVAEKYRNFAIAENVYQRIYGGDGIIFKRKGDHHPN